MVGFPEFYKLTEPFVSNPTPFVQSSACAAAGIAQPNSCDAPAGSEEQISFRPDETDAAPLEWQPDESALFPNFGVDRARELLMWLINLEMRLPPYSEVSPA